jgi:hypothetical protein
MMTEPTSPSTSSSHSLPPLPPIGKPESFYSKLAHEADKAGDVHLHESAKVGQYITLALDRHLGWDEKLKYFRHAIKRHCNPPSFPDDEVWTYYRNLADLVRQHAGQQALKLASQEDDMYAARLSMGQEREMIENEAEEFFAKMIGSGDHCPEWFLEEDYQQIKMIRDQWI